LDGHGRHAVSRTRRVRKFVWIRGAESLMQLRSWRRRPTFEVGRELTPPARAFLGASMSRDFALDSDPLGGSASCARLFRILVRTLAFAPGS